MHHILISGGRPGTLLGPGLSAEVGAPPISYDADFLRSECRRLVLLLAPDEKPGLAWKRVYDVFRTRTGIHPEMLRKQLHVGSKLEAIVQLGALPVLLDCIWNALEIYRPTS